MAIDSKHPAYEEHLESWEEIEAAVRGKKAIVKLQIPAPAYRETAKNTAKVQQRRKAYFDRGRYFNATGRTLEAFLGMVFSEKPEVELDSSLEYLLQDAGAGKGLTQVAQDAVKEMISKGRFGMLVDMPFIEGGLSYSELEQGGKTPKIITYKPSQIVNWRDGVEVRLLETYEEVTNDGLDWKIKDQIRRLVLIDGVYHNQVWREKELISSVQPRQNGSLMNYLPFQFFGSDSNTCEVSKAPLFDLADYNIGHFLLDCDNRENLHYHGQGMTVVHTDLPKEDFDILNPGGLDSGAKGMNLLAAGDKVEILQIAATGAISEEMGRDEKRMVMLGAQLVLDTNSNATLGAKEMEFSSSTSTLKQISHNASEGLTNVINWCGAYLGLSDNNKYTLSHDFVVDTMSPQMVTAHLQSIIQGVLPESTFGDTARKAGFTNMTDDEIASENKDQAFNVGGTSFEQAQQLASQEGE